MQYQLADVGVLRLDDNAWIPSDINNRDWQDYQLWLTVKGNVPLVAVPPVAPAPPQSLLDQVNAMSQVDRKSLFGLLTAATAVAGNNKP